MGAPPARAASLALRLEEPAPDTATRLPLVEVKGNAGSAAGAAWDLVIVLDLSESTLHPSGLDLDGDGPGGRSDPALLAAFRPTGFAGPGLLKRLREDLDFEDTILAAELEAARALVERLAGGRFRIGLVGFSDRAHVLAPLGTPPVVLTDTLDELKHSLGDHLRGTHYRAAVRTAQSLLVPDPDEPPDRRRRAVVFLSDGAPSLPVFWGDGGRRPALEAAREAGILGIRIFAFAFGSEAAEATQVLEQMAEWTDGEAKHVEHPEELVSMLRELNLGDVERVTIRNVSTDTPARAVRLFPDGSFDGLVTLQPGANLLRIEAFSRAGERARVDRAVQRLSGTSDDAEAAQGRALLDALRQRTAEMEAWAEVERRRQEQRRTLTIEPSRAP
ncbi:MAG: vWA domain-containing protein [Myxococcota bacterium]